ncbi:MAG: hypothetical protein J5I92_15145 [Thiogranum sp.]|nr:hypothetical protein [Thiogranum sp.]
MPSQAPLIVRAAKDVAQSLENIGLTKDIVVEVALSAAAARADTLPVDPSSAPGMMSYIHGVRAIRLNLLTAGWRISRQGNVESTVNDEQGIQLCFQNVDVACDVNKIPHAISGKGTASRGLVAAGQGELFGEAGIDGKVKVFGSTPTVWVICVSVHGFSVRAEVSCPTSFEGSQFEDFHQRIFVLDESFDPTLGRKNSAGEEADDFDVHISKK